MLKENLNYVAYVNENHINVNMTEFRNICEEILEEILEEIRRNPKKINVEEQQVGFNDNT